MNDFLFPNKHYKTLNVLSLGREQCEPLHTFRYAYTNFYLIHYIISGCGTVKKNDSALKRVSAGEIFIIKPGSIYTYTADRETPWDYMWFSFDGELAGIFEKTDDIISVKNDSMLFDMLELSSLNNTRTEYITGKLYEFISEIFEPAPAKKNYAKTVSDYIKANYMHNISVSDIASAMGLNSKYLSRIFKNEYGMSIQEYILKYKFAKAKKLLSSGMSVSDTSFVIGYQDPFAFSKIFKKHVGVSPSEYSVKTDIISK